MEKTVREASVEWWNGFSLEEKFYKVISWLKQKQMDATSKHPNYLTGREIEEIWLKEHKLK